MGNVLALKIPAPPEFGGGDGGDSYQYVCPDCEGEKLHVFDDGTVVCADEMCGAVLSLRCVEEE